MNDDHNPQNPTPEWRLPEEEQLETDAYHIWKPRPLLRSVHWKPVPEVAREAAAGSYDVFLDQRVFSAMHQHMWNAAPGEEPFGFLAGDLCEDPDSGRRYIIISAAIPASRSLVEPGPEQIPGEVLVALQLEVDRRRGVLAGWYHRHPSGEVRLSAADVGTHDQHFPEPWQVAVLFVTDHARPAGGCFRRTNEGFSGDQALPFFEMVSNESLLAHGQRRSFLDWSNVETVDPIQSHPPPRPEPLPEPEEEAVPEAEVEAVPEAEEEAVPEAEEEAVPEPEEEAVPEAEVEAVPEAEDDFDLVLPVVDLAEGEIDAEDLDSIVEELGLAEEDFDEVSPGTESEIAAEASAADEMPEPGWDAPRVGGPVGPSTLDDVDLESFVTEVELADVDSQIGSDEEAVAPAPDWDDPATGDEPSPPALETTPVYEELPLEELPPEEETPADAPRVARDVPAAAAAGDAAPDVAGPRPEAAAPGARAGRRSRRPPVALIVAVVVVAAIVVSVFTFLRSTEGTSPDGTPVRVGAESPGGGEEGSPPAGEGPDAQASGTEGAAAAVGDTVAPVDSDRIESLGESLLESISRYYGLAVALDQGRAECSALQEAYVEVENRWMAYNVEGKARFRGRLPDDLAARDERLYEGVQDVEQEFGRSGCERP